MAAVSGPVHGATWHLMVDGLLDRLSEERRRRENLALVLAALAAAHPELRADENLLAARRQLL